MHAAQCCCSHEAAVQLTELVHMWRCCWSTAHRLVPPMPHMALPPHLSRPPLTCACSLGLQIRLDDPAKYQSIVDAEWNIIYDKLKKCVDSGASIVLSRLAIGEAQPVTELRATLPRALLAAHHMAPVGSS